MSYTRGQVTRLALHDQVDYTDNFYTSELRVAKFNTILDDITQEIDFPSLRVESYGRYGKSSTQIDITNPASTTFRYTWDGNGYDPNFETNGLTVGDTIHINLPDADTYNNGSFVVTAVSDSYFEITNADGVVESNLKVKKGYLWNDTMYTKTDQNDYFMPTDFQKFGGIVKIGSSEYKAFDEDRRLQASDYDKNLVWIEKGRMVFSPTPTAGQFIELDYYKEHPEIQADGDSLELEDESRETFKTGLEWQFKQSDEANTSQEAQLKYGEYTAMKTKLRSFFETRRLKGKDHVFNDVPETTFNVF